MDVQGNVVDDAVWSDLVADGIQGQGRSGCSGNGHAQPPALRRLRRMSQKKNGPPTREVSIPIGRSAAGMSVRANRSAYTSRVAPPMTDNSNSQRWPGPISIRIRCGTTSRSEEHTSELQSR